MIYWLVAQYQRLDGYSHYKTEGKYLKDSLLEDDVDKVENDRYFSADWKRSSMFDVFENKNYQIILTDDIIVIKTNGDNVHIGDCENDLAYLIDSIIISNNLKVTMIRTELTTKDLVENIIKKPREKQTILREEKNVGYPRLIDIAENLSTSYEINYFNEMKPSLYKKVEFSTAEYYDLNVGRVIIKIATYLINSDTAGFSNDILMDQIKKLRTYAKKELKDSFTKEYIDKTF